MSLNYSKPTWTNDEGTAINASRLQAISDVLDGLINQEETKAIVHIEFNGNLMTATYADGSIKTVENPFKGEKGDQGEAGPEGPAGKDGIDGKDGVDGKDGINGVDGYTPVKGVDYFDGENGKDGVDGKDGINGINGADGTSLTATSSKSGKTTIVKIKNASTGEVLTTLTINDGVDGTGGGGDMTKAEYASSTFGVVKKAETANSAETANTANSATSADHALNADTAENVPWESTNHPDGLHGYHLYDEVLSLIDSTIGGAINGRY